MDSNSTWVIDLIFSCPDCLHKALHIPHGKVFLADLIFFCNLVVSKEVCILLQHNKYQKFKEKYTL